MDKIGSWMIDSERDPGRGLDNIFRAGLEIFAQHTRSSTYLLLSADYIAKCVVADRRS